MNKIILAVIALLSLNIASAQFQVQQKHEKPHAVWSDAFGWATLYKQEIGNGDRYYFIACRSSNKFDDMMIINLGKTNKAKTTLSQFYDLYSKGVTYDLVDDRGEKFSAQGVACGGIKGFYIHKSGYAGYGSILLNQISKMQDAIGN